MTTPTAPVEALRRAEMKLSAYVGVCKGDKELTDTVLPMVREALAALTVSPATDEEITPAEAAKRDVEAVYVKHGPALVEALLASPDAHMGHSPEEWNRLMAECPVPATDEGTLKRGNGTGGWTIDTDLLRAIRDDAGEWAKESYLETVQAIALAVERHLSRARVAPATDDIGRLVVGYRWRYLDPHTNEKTDWHYSSVPHHWADKSPAVEQEALVPETALLSQQSEINRLREALEPFAQFELPRHCLGEYLRIGFEQVTWNGEHDISPGDFYRARAALPKAST